MIVSFSYKPIITPRAFRWSAISEHLATQGIHIDVICMPGLPREEVLNGVHVYRTGVYDKEILWRRFRKVEIISDTGHKKDKDFVDSNKSSKLFALVRRIYDSTWKKVYWPDYACLWYFPALRQAKYQLATYKYDALITVSHPFTGHLVGLQLKKLMPDIRWIVDIGDPFCYAKEMPLNNFTLYNKLNTRVERNVFRQANKVIVTNRRAQERYIETFGGDICRNMVVVGPIATTANADFSSVELPFDSREQLNIVFAGNLINPVRRPQSFIEWVVKVLQEWYSRGNTAKLLFHFFGDPVSEIQRYVTPANIVRDVKFHGRVDRVTALNAVMQADILVNCGNITDYQLPSKIYEYMASGKPIINVIFNPRDPSIEALAEYPYVMNFHIGATEIPAVVEFIEQKVQQAKNHYANRSLDIIRKHGVENIAQKYLDVIL